MDGAFRQLEEEYAEFVGHKHAVSCNSGTSALHLALMSLGIGEGDEVIVPEFTMAATAFAVSYTGAKPVFVDCGKDLNIDVMKIEEKITPKTRAIIPVHIYGRLANMKVVNVIAKTYGLYVIEDACEAQGAKVGDADISCFSFYRNKIIPAQEGGIITTNNRILADRANDLKNMSFGYNHTYLHSRIGYNYRMPDAMAEMALNNLRRVDEILEKRRTIEKWYQKYLPDTRGHRDAVWVYDTDLEYVEDKLTRPFFKPMSMQTPYFDISFQKTEANKHRNKMYFQVWEDMTEDDVRGVVNRVV